ncbi:unnamed protein product [Urochloa decumbens]|uniref:Uncharacterized protein n=1 Tax=Urochloa decumbens TaxID=240449 RepID=A0ABC9C479_9POAL
MEDLLWSALEPVMGSVKDTIVTSLTTMWGIDESRRKMELQLLSIQSVLADAKVRCESNPEIRTWMNEVRFAAYRADNILDLFRYLALRKQAQIDESTMRKIRGKIVQNRSLDRVNLSMELNSVSDLINGLTKDMQRFNFLVGLPVSAATNTVERETFSTPSPYREFFGREDDKIKIVNLLLGQFNHDGIQVLPIVGMGGLGKTTLANEVFNDEKISEHFNLQLWLFVPADIDLCGVIRLMLELVTNTKCDSDSIEVLKGKLIAAISKRRFLLVMDDVCTTNQWIEKVFDILSWAAGPGSCVLVTTRNHQVASIMGTLETHHLEPLNENDAWQFFSARAFSKDVPQQLHEEMAVYGKAIVEQCQGLPLALKVVSAVMAKKHLVSEWKSTAESKIFKCTESGNKVLTVLKSSWDQLSRESKICFAFLAYFPKGYTFDKESLIQMWAGLGYLRTDLGMSVEEKGEMVFEDLEFRCFLQVSKKEGYSRYACMGDDWGYEQVICSMHDLVHELAQSLSDEECFSCEELVKLKDEVSAKFKFGCHVMIPRCASLSQFQEVGRALSGKNLMRTLCTSQPVFSYIGKGPKELELTSLRILETEFLPNMFRQLEYLVHLRYLDLSYSLVVTLPESVCFLYHLQTLKLNYCIRLESLPEGVGAMKQLQHIYLICCDSLNRMPRNMGMLVNLHTLTRFVADGEQGRGIDELKNMQLLRNRLEIFGLQKVNNVSSARDASLNKKDKITDLLLSWGGEYYCCGEEYPLGDEECRGHEAVLQSLVPHSRLHFLRVEDYGGQQVAAWMRDSQNFHCLKKLRMSGFRNCVDVPLVWLSSTLEYLDLSDFPNLTVLCNNLSVAEGCNSPLCLFPSLKIMELSLLPKFLSWAETTSPVIFPKLEVLSICCCKEINSVPKCPLLKKIEVVECFQLDLSAFEDVKSLLHITYRFSGCGVGEEHANHFPLDSWPALHRLDMNSLILTGTTPPLPESSECMTHLQTLRVLRLDGNGCHQIGLWNYFSFVEVLEINCCLDIFTWPKDIEKLKRLKVLHVTYCPELTTNGSAGEGVLVFPPNLERLHVRCCMKLTEIPDLPESLQEVMIHSCPKLKVVPSGPGRLPSLPNLKHLSLYSCGDLEELPSGELSSLLTLRVCDCPKVCQFPLGILVRMHDKSFEHLVVKGCPYLQAACSGPYSDLVSSIPLNDVEAYEKQTSRWWSCLARPCAGI